MGSSVLCSMAMRGLLAELAGSWDGGATVEATGGVDAARRVRAGEPVEVVVLAGPVMCKLEAEGHLVPGSLVGIARSATVLAVREGDPVPDLSDAAAVRRSLLAAERIGYSTGPSGDHLLALLARWGLGDTLAERLVQAPPGVPVGRLLLSCLADIGLQQRSELTGMPGVAIAGALPLEIALDTVFTAGLARAGTEGPAARDLIGFLASPSTAEAKRRHGMDPA